MKILVVCNAGMSSSILVKNIKHVASQNNQDVDVVATGVSNIVNEKGKWDVCLVAPQISYAVDEVKQKLAIPVAAIDMRVYAMSDGKGALEQAISLLGL